MQAIETYAVQNKAKHEFDLLTLPKGRAITVRKAQCDDTIEACEFVRKHLTSLTVNLPHVQKILSINNDGFFIFNKKEKMVGLFILLMLNKNGHQMLLDGNLDGESPNLKCLSKTPEKTDAIYIWVTIAPGMAATGIRHVSQYLNNSPYSCINIYARPVTDAGLQISINVGFKPVQSSAIGLYKYTRLKNRIPKSNRVMECPNEN